MDEFEAIAREAIERAEKMTVPIEEFYAGLQQIIDEIEIRMGGAEGDGIELEPGGRPVGS